MSFSPCEILCLYSLMLYHFFRFPTIEELTTFAFEREKEGLGMWCPHKTLLKDGFIVRDFL